MYPKKQKEKKYYVEEEDNATLKNLVVGKTHREICARERRSKAYKEHYNSFAV